jgi:xanthine dehydrogenase YagS FAD-binding subunit
MRPFVYDRADSPEAATRLAAVPADAHVRAPVQFLAGGTTLLDLMKLDVMRPDRLVDINPLADTPAGRIDAGERGLRLGALVRMADAAGHPVVQRDYPVVAQALQQAASQQLRNMASLGGNVLQRTRCLYFRDTSWPQCNKREPGSGCAALGGVNRQHAILGTSDQCIASYPGDFAQALVALDATVEVAGPRGTRTLPFSGLHRPPGETPQIETTLVPGELITALTVPAGPWTRRSLYLKVRDRESYEFALASAAVVLHLENGTVREARIALGGVATVPWRAKAAEAALKGRKLNDDVVLRAADAAFADAQPHEHNAFKIELGKRTLKRAIAAAASMEIRT